jgi:hypothetical protein
MNPFNIILILVILVILIYIFYRMIQDKQLEKGGEPQQPYSDETTVSKESELNGVQNISNGSGVTSLNIVEGLPLQLRDYCIKSSSNSAYSGGYMNTNMVKYVLSRGCRFLDFEVYYKDDIPIVAYSRSLYDPSYSSFTSVDLPISLNGVFSTIMGNAFNDNSPNQKDPLFIQLRIKTYINEAYSKIAKSIKSLLKNKLHRGPVTPDTPIAQLMGQIIVIIDRSTSPAYSNFPICNNVDPTCDNLKNWVNMESGTDTVRVYKEPDLLYQAINPPDPGVYLMRIVMPSPGVFSSKNCDSMSLIKNYGAQIVAQSFYLNDARLAVYEDLFRNYKSAFVPIEYAMQYIKESGNKGV